MLIPLRRAALRRPSLTRSLILRSMMRFWLFSSRPHPNKCCSTRSIFLKHSRNRLFLHRPTKWLPEPVSICRTIVSGLSYAENSLLLLPENSLLLVAVADVEAREGHNDAAIVHARDALDDLDRFGPPATVTPQDWPELKRKLAASANFALGRASLAKALDLPAGQERTLLVRDCELSLSKAQELNPSDPEVTYLLGLAHLVSGNLNLAAGNFARVYQGGSEFAPESLRNLQSIYKALETNTGVSFEEFLKQSEASEMTSRTSTAQAEKPNAPVAAEYAGSEACRTCHGEIYRAWSQSGMAKMLRPYSPQNVIGDFQSHNEFYLDDEISRSAATPQGAENHDRALFARMITRDGRHYFDIQQL